MSCFLGISMNIFIFYYNILIKTWMAGYFLITLLCVEVERDLPW